MSRCPHCKQLKQRTEFYTDGHYCKECKKADEARRRRDPECIAKFRQKYATNRRFRASEKMFRRIKKRSKAGGLQFDLDVDWIVERLDKGCELSGLPFDFSAGGIQPHGPSVDRIAAGGGYTKRNCRLVLNCVNLALMDWGFEVFVAVAEAIAERHGKKGQQQ